MNFLARSSRATGPKMRVPIGSPSSETRTVVVEVERLVRHGRYRKYLKQRRRYKAHDQKEQCPVGDRVRII